VAHYMAKYMSKNFTDNRLTNKKKYFGSRLLDRPTVLREPAHIDQVRSFLPSSFQVYSKKYTSKFMGASFYAVYERIPLPLIEKTLSEPASIPRYFQDW